MADRDGFRLEPGVQAWRLVDDTVVGIVDGCRHAIGPVESMPAALAEMAAHQQHCHPQPVVAPPALVGGERLLTDLEHQAVAQLGGVWNMLCRITADGPGRVGDLQELRGHIHALQQAVLKQAAARAYPGLYRLLGGTPPGGGV